MEILRLVNLTPHQVRIYLPDGGTLEFAPSGTMARVLVKRGGLDQVEVEGHRVPTCRAQPGELVGLPEPKDGVGYLISSLVANHPLVACRADVFVPDKVIRDPETGHPLGCTRLARP